MVTLQLSASPHFFCHSWAPQNCFPSGSLCLFYWAFGELGEGKNQQSVVMLMENHMLCKAAYALCLRCTWKYARINTCQLPNLPRLENSKSLCSYAKNTAWVKFCRLLKLKELIRGLQTQIPRASRQVVLMRKAGQAWPAGNWDGLRTTQTSSFRQVCPLKNRNKKARNPDSFVSSPDFSDVVGSFGFILNYCRGWTTLQIRFDPWISSLRTLLERFHNLVMVEGFDGKFSQCYTDGDCQICQQAFLFPISPNSDIVWPVFIGDVASWIGFQMINSVVCFSCGFFFFFPICPLRSILHPSLSCSLSPEADLYCFALVLWLLVEFSQWEAPIWAHREGGRKFMGFPPLKAPVRQCAPWSLFLWVLGTTPSSSPFRQEAASNYCWIQSASFFLVGLPKPCP